MKHVAFIALCALSLAACAKKGAYLTVDPYDKNHPCNSSTPPAHYGPEYGATQVEAVEDATENPVQE